jgi:hypothetical protein
MCGFSIGETLAILGSHKLTVRLWAKLSADATGSNRRDIVMWYNLMGPFRPFQMLKHCIVGVLLGIWAFSSALSSQLPGKVNFRRDVQPLLKQYCIECHGPTQQINGFPATARGAGSTKN